MTFFVVRHGWRYPLWLALGATGFFLLIEMVFFTSNAVKVLSGGWFTLLVAGVVFVVMATWKRGRDLLSAQVRKDSIELPAFMEAIFTSPPTRVEGTAVFLSGEPGFTPSALMHNLKHNKVLHAQNLFITVQHHEVPWVAQEHRIELHPLGRDCWQVTIHFGFKNEPDVPEALRRLEGQGIDLDPMRTSYFLSRDIVIPTFGTGMSMWREKLFASMHRNAAAAADFLHLPANRVVELGAKVSI
jgi:KUP system potassium uptake protein